MNGRVLVEWLRELCDDIDAGRPVRRLSLRRALSPVVAPVLLSVALASGGCSSATPDPVRPPGEPAAIEVCGDGVDNDDDGAVDCTDSDCVAEAACRPAAEHAAPPPPLNEESCVNGVDEDGDGLYDCDDDDCREDDHCRPPEGEQSCVDGVDEDGDGLYDCDDDDCRMDDHCRPPEETVGEDGMPVILYSCPFA